MVYYNRPVWVLLGLFLIYRKNVVYSTGTGTDQYLSAHTTHLNGRPFNVSIPSTKPVQTPAHGTTPIFPSPSLYQDPRYLIANQGKLPPSPRTTLRPNTIKRQIILLLLDVNYRETTPDVILYQQEGTNTHIFSAYDPYYIKMVVQGYDLLWEADTKPYPIGVIYHETTKPKPTLELVYPEIDSGIPTPIPSRKPTVIDTASVITQQPGYSGHMPSPSVTPQHPPLIPTHVPTQQLSRLSQPNIYQGMDQHIRPGLAPGQPTTPRATHPCPRPTQSSTSSQSPTVTHPSTTLIDLDLAYQGPTHGYSVSIDGPKTIFTANSPYLFGKIVNGSQLLWQFNNNGYPNKVVYNNINGQNNVDVFFPPIGTRVSSATTPGLSPGMANTDTHNLRFNLSFSAPVVDNQGGQLPTGVTTPSLSDQGQVAHTLTTPVKPESVVKPVKQPSAEQVTTHKTSLSATAFIKLGSKIHLFVEAPKVPGICASYNLSTNNRGLLNKYQFVNHQLGDQIKCTLVMFEDKPLWRFDPKFKIIPKSIAWHELSCIVLIQVDNDLYRLYTKNKNSESWIWRGLGNTIYLKKDKIKLFRNDGSKLKELPADRYQFKDLGFAFEYVFKDDCKCEKLTYDKGSIYTYDATHNNGNYPKVLYVFSDKTGHVIYPEGSFYLFSPFDVSLVLDSVKKSTVQFDYDKTNNLLTYTAKQGYRFSSVNTKSGCSSSSCSGTMESIWDGKYSFLYGTQVVYDCRNPIEKTVIIHLDNGGKIVFNKPDKNKNWIKTEEILSLIKLHPNGYPANIKLLTADATDTSKTKEIESSQYKVKQDPSKTDIFVYELNDGSNCSLVKCDDKDVWKYDSTKFGGKYPKSINYNKKDSVFLVNIDDIVLLCKKLNGQWVCNELKKGIVMDLNISKTSTYQFDYKKNNNVAIYTARQGFGFNLLKQGGQEIWKTNKNEEYASIVKVKNPDGLFIDVYLHLTNGTKLLYLKDSDVTGWYSYNLSKKNPVFVNVNLEKESFKYKNELAGTTRTFTAKDGFVFNRVIQYNFIKKKNINIWQTENENEWANKVIKHGDKKVVVYIGRADSGYKKVFYKGFDGNWKEDTSKNGT